jgi:putative flippase GtrA
MIWRSFLLFSTCAMAVWEARIFFCASSTSSSKSALKVMANSRSSSIGTSFNCCIVCVCVCAHPHPRRVKAFVAFRERAHRERSLLGTE